MTEIFRSSGPPRIDGKECVALEVNVCLIAFYGLMKFIVWLNEML